MAGNDEIQSKWTADFGGLTNALGEVTDKSDDTFSKLLDGALESSEGVAAAQERVAESVHALAENVHEEGVNISESLKGIQHDFEELKEVVGYAFVVEGLEKLGEKVEELTSRAVNMQNMADVMKITTDQYQALAAAAEESGAPMGIVNRAVDRMVLLLQQARDGAAGAQDKLHLLGITNEEFSDKSFGTIDALRVIHERLEETATATAESNATLEVFGIRGALAASALKEFDGSNAAVAEKLKAVNGLTQEQIKQLKELHAQYGELTTRMENFWEKTLVFISEGVKGLSDFGKDLKALDLSHIVEDDEAAEDKKAGHGGGGEGSGKTDTGLAGRLAAEEAAKEAAHNNDKARRTEDGSEKDAAASKDHARDAEGLASHEAAAKEGSEADKKETETKKALTAEQLASESSALSQYKSGTEARLAALKKYAADVKATYTGNVATVQAASAQVAAAERELQEARKHFIEGAEQELSGIYSQIEQERLKTSIQTEKLRNEEISSVMKETETTLGQLAQDAATDQINAVDLQVAAVKNAYTNQAVSATEAYKQEVSLAQQKLQAQLQLAAQEKAIYAGDEKAEEAAGRKAVLAQKEFDQQVLKSKQQLIKRIEQEWAPMTSALKSSLSSALAGMLEGTMTFGEAMRSILKSVVEAMIQMFVNWAITAIEQYILVKAVGAATGSGQVATNAAVAATAAMGSVAAIPFYGWALAPEVGAATYAEAISYESIASAAGGYEVPHDMIAQVHKDEKVLPARFNDGLTNLVNSYSSGGNNDPDGGKKTKGGGFSLNVRPVGDDDMLVKRGDLVTLMQRANNQFRFGGGAARR